MGFKKHTKKSYREEHQLSGCGKCPERVITRGDGHRYDVCRKEVRLIDTDSIPDWCPLPDGETTYYLACPYCDGRCKLVDGFTGERYECPACLGRGEIPMETARIFLETDLFYYTRQRYTGWEKCLDGTGLRAKGYYDNNIYALWKGCANKWPGKKHSDIWSELLGR